MFLKLKKLIRDKKTLLIVVVFILLFSEIIYFQYLGKRFFESSNKDFKYKKLGFENKRGNVGKWQKELREKLIELSGASLEVPSVDLIWTGEQENKGLYQEQQLKLLFNIDKEVFCHLLKPEKSQGKIPAVIFFPGNGEGIKELLEEPEDRGLYYQQAAAKYLAENGFITLVCEPWAFWSSSSWQGQRPVAINEYFLKGTAIMGIYIDQARAEFSYLESLENVDAKKIGLAGVSFGGAVSFYTAAIDERITASFISGFLTTFEKTYFYHPHSIEMIIPGLYQYADIVDIAGLIAPREVMFDNGETDNSLAMTGDLAEKLVEQRIRPIFKEFSAEDKVKVNKTELGHVLDREAALNFFKQTFNFDE